jgi:hypothetical protein
MLLVLSPVFAGAEIQVISLRTSTPPVVDGDSSDAVWRQARPVLINDKTSGETIILTSVYTDSDIYFLVQYPDKAENPLHKPWMWDQTAKAYLEGPHREDTFVFKWNMLDTDVDLSVFSDDDYRADVWYWKANRSNPAGYADDKMHILSSTADGRVDKTLNKTEVDQSTALLSVSGHQRYLIRVADQGNPAYSTFKPDAKGAPVLDQYPSATPSGSRADVRAKGSWQGGFWFVEFSRKLTTGHDDDVQFDPPHPALFGVSIFSLYGNKLDVQSPNLYGMGRISAPLRLIFSP